MKSSFLLIVRHVTVMLAVMAGVLSALAAEPLRVFIRGGSRTGARRFTLIRDSLESGLNS